MLVKGNAEHISVKLAVNVESSRSRLDLVSVDFIVFPYPHLWLKYVASEQKR